MVQKMEAQVALVHIKLLSQISVISQQKWLKFGLQAHLFKMFGHTKFQLSISFTKVMKVFVGYLVISTKCFITMKVQEIES